MVSNNSQLKQDLLVTLLIIAIIGGITGAILYKQQLDNQGPDNTDNPNPNPPVDNNNNTDTDTNTTNPDNGNVTDPQDYFEHICNIEPKADVCIKPLNNTNSNTN